MNSKLEPLLPEEEELAAETDLELTAPEEEEELEAEPGLELAAPAGESLSEEEELAGYSGCC